MSKVKPLPLFGDEPTPEQEAQPRKSRTKRDVATSEQAAQSGIYPAADGHPLLLVRCAESDPLGVHSAAELVRAAAERGWQAGAYAIGGLGSISGAQAALYAAARGESDDALALLGGLMPLHTGEQVEVRGKLGAMAATPLLLIAQDEAGAANLGKLSARGALDLDGLHANGDGLVAVSLNWAATILHGSKKEQQALNRALMVVKQACGGRLYLGVDAAEVASAARLQKQAAELGLPLIALHQADYIDEADAPVYATLRVLQGLPPADALHPLLTAEQARAAFATLPDALANASSLSGQLASLPPAPLQPPSVTLPPPLAEPDATAAAELAQVKAAGLTFAYQLAAELATYGAEQGFELRVGAGQGGDYLARALGAGALPVALLPVAGTVGRSLCLEYPAGRERQLLEYVAANYANHACLLIPPPRTGLRLALRDAAKATGASDSDLLPLLRRARDGDITAEGLSESELALLALAQPLVGRFRAGESGNPSLLLSAAPLADSLLLEQSQPLPILRLSRAAAGRLGAMRIDLTASSALDLLDKAGGGQLRDIALDDAATLALLRAGEVEDIETGVALPAADSLPALLETLAAQAGVASDDAAIRTLAWDNYRLAYLKAHQPQQYYAAVSGPLGLHPLAAHAEHWRAALADARLFSTAALPEAGAVGRALGQLRAVRRLVSSDGNPFVAARLQDLVGEINIFAYPPVNTTLAALGEGRLLLAYGTMLAADGQAALFVEQVKTYEGGAIGPLPAPISPPVPQRSAEIPTDIFAAGVVLEATPMKAEPHQAERTNPVTVNRASNGNAPARGGGKDGARQGNRGGGSAPPPPPPPEPNWVRRLHLRLPVSEDEEADIDLMNEVARLAKRNVGPDMFLIYLRSGEYTVRIEPRGFGIDASAFRQAVSALLGHDPVFDEDEVEI